MTRPRDPVAAARLELALADALLDEAQAREEAAWSSRATDDFIPATEATRLRRKAEFVQSTARQRLELLTGQPIQEDGMSATTTVESMKAEREALVKYRNEAKGSAKRIASKQIREIDARIAEFEVPEPREADEYDPETGTDRPIEPEVEVEVEVEVENAEPPAPAEDAPAPESIEQVIEGKVKVTKSMLIALVVAAADGPDADLTAIGDPVVEAGLLKAYSPKWVGKWLGTGPEKAARKQLAEAQS